MAQVVYGDDATFNALAFGDPHPNTIQYLTQQFHQASDDLKQLGSDIYQASLDAFNKYVSEDAVRRAKAALRHIGALWEQDNIHFICEIAQFQHAKPVMQRWIMAEPSVRTLYHANRVDGYSESYVDYQPDAVGEDHYDYRRAMDGWVVINESEGPEWHSDTFFDELLPGDEHLQIEDQVCIQETWRELCWQLSRRQDDPTSRFNAQLM